MFTEKFEEMWNEIKYLIKAKHNNSDDYYLTNEINSDDDLLLKSLAVYNMAYIYYKCF